jgi:hypothetical protein
VSPSCRSLAASRRFYYLVRPLGREACRSSVDAIPTGQHRGASRKLHEDYFERATTMRTIIRLYADTHGPTYDVIRTTPSGPNQTVGPNLRHPRIEATKISWQKLACWPSRSKPAVPGFRVRALSIQRRGWSCSQLVPRKTIFTADTPSASAAHQPSYGFRRCSASVLGNLLSLRWAKEKMPRLTKPRK